MGVITGGGTGGMPRTPVELAELRAEQASVGHGFEQTPQDERLLAELDHAAEELGFTDSSYFVESGRALIVPASFDADRPVAYTSLFGLSFEGSFATYSKVHIGRLIGGESIRAVCLTFGEAILLPFFDPLEEGDLLHVPVLAVDSMECTSS